VHAIASGFCLSVHLSSQDTIVLFSASRRTILLLSGQVKFIRI